MKPDEILPQVYELTLYEETLRMSTTKLGADHPHTLRTLSNFA
jgi:hypothetical protein